jgi:DNA uptake protein ComE-like DNA-binding protein
MTVMTIFAAAALLLAASTQTATAQTAAAQGTTQALVNPNAASEKELAALPHMSAAAAKMLVEKRPFKTMLDVNAVLSKSLTQKQLTELYGKLFIPISLNTASRPEILLIPGVGSRMAHEFEEYRPYTSIEQFRKEIGKYVSKEEVARLERYVSLK